MAEFYWVGNLYGGHEPVIKEFPIATATAITKGSWVQRSSGLVIAMADPTDADDPVLGVAAEDHDGATAGRESGLVIKVICNPDAVFGVRPTETITATGGSTTTFVDSNLKNQDHLYKGGFIKVVSCAAGIAAGTIIPITGYTGATGTITFDTQAAKFAGSDTVILYPPAVIGGNHDWSLNSTANDLDFDTTGGETFTVLDADPNVPIIRIFARLHELGNSTLAI